MTGNDQQLLYSKHVHWFVIAAACILFGLFAPATAQREALDQHVYARTLVEMNKGAD